MEMRGKIISLYYSVDEKQLNKYNLFTTLDYLEEMNKMGIDSINVMSKLANCLAYLKWMINVDSNQYANFIQYTVVRLESIYNICGILAGILDAMEMSNNYVLA